MQPLFSVIKKGCSLNKKWLFCEKNHFLFSDQVKKMSLDQSGKNRPKTQFGLNMTFFNMARKEEVIFLVKKITFDFLMKWKNVNFNLNWDFGPFFCHFGLLTFSWLGQKKSDFFHKIITLCESLYHVHFLRKLKKWTENGGQKSRGLKRIFHVCPKYLLDQRE